jgi:hypothetical protein
MGQLAACDQQNRTVEYSLPTVQSVGVKMTA